jgi:tetratricopeptide (TPR) repeat protein
VLEGSVQKTPRRLRINAQLVDAVTGRHVWAERFDRRVADLLAVQDEITRAIVLHLSVELGEGEAARLRLKDTANLRVYELYMRARSLWLSNYTCDALREVFALHEQARELDSGSYLPYTGLSAAHSAAVVFGCTRSPVESLNQAIAMAERAIALNPWNSFALSMRGWQHLLLREYDEAVETLQRAIVASPNDADSYAYYGWALVYVGRHEEAREAMQKAMHLHPYYPAWYPCAAGLASFWLGRPDEGIEDMMLGFERAPNNLTRLAYLAAVHSAAGNLQQARHWAHEVLRVKPDFSAGAWVATTQPYQDPADAARVLALLQEAGLPD